MNKKKAVWGVISVFIAILSIWAVTSQTKSFSGTGFIESIKNAKPGYLILAIICMFGFIVFEGLAINTTLKSLGYKKGIYKSIEYASADIYFSAITPSASGGQPASAAFMLKDNVPAAVSTVTLLVNLFMYTASIIVLGIIGLLICPDVFLSFNSLSKLFIIIGYAVLIFLGVLFIILLVRERLLLKICDIFLSLLSRLHLVRRVEKKRKKLEKVMKDYHDCVEMIGGQTGLLLKIFINNLLQRLSQIMVTVMMYMATGGSFKLVAKIWSAQSMVAVGSNCAPVPGAMGVADYLMIDGFDELIGGSRGVNLELLSRGVSFYVCIAVSGIIVLSAYIRRRVKRAGEDK